MWKQELSLSVTLEGVWVVPGISASKMTIYTINRPKTFKSLHATVFFGKVKINPSLYLGICLEMMLHVMEKHLLHHGLRGGGGEKKL
jgi:hypothetical protein